jgi:NAD(P)H-flavin reductase
MNCEKQGNTQSVHCKLIFNDPINTEIFRLDFVWPGSAIPKAGQFFMVKPRRSAVFLARPISVAMWQPDTVSFLVALRGNGTQELAAMRSGEEAELIGPLGNAWSDFLPPVKNGNSKPIALVGGGIGLAPLNALLFEFKQTPEYRFDLYAGFRTDINNEEKLALLGTASPEANIIIATEDGKNGRKGRIPDFLEATQYAAVCACGPEPMLKAVAVKCNSVRVPCFISMEKRMACGVGACLGCTVRTVNGNRRCCADGPIFKADEVVFDE